MTEISVRKSQLILDKIWHDGGPAAKEPRRRTTLSVHPRSVWLARLRITLRFRADSRRVT